MGRLAPETSGEILLRFRRLKRGHPARVHDALEGAGEQRWLALQHVFHIDAGADL